MDNIFTLAAIEAFYNDGNDFSQILPFFVLQTLKDKNFGEPILLSEIKKDLSDNFNLSVPTASINIALDKLVNKEYIKRGNDEVVLLDKGNNVSTELKHKINESRRKYNSLIKKLQQFSDYSRSLSQEKLENSLLSFIRKNINATIKVLEDDFDIDSEEYTEEESLVLSFICKIEQYDNTSFQDLSSLINAEIVRCVIQKEHIDTSYLQIKSMSLFLDTNILVGIFKFDSQIFSQRMLELLEIAKEFNFNIKIFDFTKEEFISTLSRYRKEYNSIISSKCDVADICYKMKARGYTITDVENFINNIDKKLSEMGIEVLNTKQINFDEIIKENKSFSNYVEDRDEITILHDTKATHLIKYLRNGLKTTIESAGLLFVTDDLSLYKYAKDLKSEREFPFVFRHDMLTNLLWFRGDFLSKATIPIYNIIAGNENKLLIKKDILEQFVKKIKSNKNLSEEEAIAIMTSAHINEILTDKSIYNDLEQVDDNVFKSKIAQLIAKDKKDAESKETQIKELKKLVNQYGKETETLKSDNLKHETEIQKLKTENINLQKQNEENKKQIKSFEEQQDRNNEIKKAETIKIFERRLKKLFFLITSLVIYFIYLFHNNSFVILTAAIPCLYIILYSIAIVSNNPISNRAREFLGESFETKHVRPFLYKILMYQAKFKFSYDELYNEKIKVKTK